MSDGTAGDLVIERRVEASPKTIFAFFTDRERWMRWQGVDALIDARPGGVFRVNVRGDGYASGEFLEVVPDRRVVFTWGWETPGSPVPPGSTVVEIDLLPEGDATVVRLTHRALPDDAYETHRHGWNNYVGRLSTVAEGGDPGPDPMRERA